MVYEMRQQMSVKDSRIVELEARMNKMNMHLQQQQQQQQHVQHHAQQQHVMYDNDNTMVGL